MEKFKCFLDNRENMKKYLMEFAGTFFLVLAIGLTGNPLAIGLMLMAVVYAGGHISGAHINPAVTIALWAGKKFEKNKVLPYILAQIAGACIASFLVFSIFGNFASVGATLPRGGGAMQSFFLEIVLTFFLMFVILGSTDKMGYKQFAGWAIGTTVGIDALIGGAISGASMNPARSFGPALISGNFAYHWIYWAAPVIGALIAVYAYKIIRK